MTDDSGFTPTPPPPPGGGSRDAVFSFHVAGAPAAPLDVVVEHRDAGDEVWLGAGGTQIHEDGTTTLRVSAVKEDWRVRVTPGAGGGSARICMAPPVWLPQ
jgi:hypothetical protein